MKSRQKCSEGIEGCTLKGKHWHFYVGGCQCAKCEEVRALETPEAKRMLAESLKAERVA